MGLETHWSVTVTDIAERHGVTLCMPLMALKFIFVGEYLLFSLFITLHRFGNYFTLFVFFLWAIDF
jgi:hypothetical protein